MMTLMQQQAIYPGAELFLLKQFMQQQGIQPQQVLLGTGLSEVQFKNAQSLVSSEQFDLIYRNLYRLADRADFGLALGRALNLSRWGLLSVALYSSRTLGDALVTAHQLRLLLRSRFTLQVTSVDEDYVIEIFKRDGIEYPLNAVFAHEMLLAGLQVQITQLLGKRFHFSDIRLNYSPPGHARHYSRFFSCPVQFDASVSSFRVKRNIMHQPLPLANPVAKQQAMQVAETELQRVTLLQQGDISYQVRAILQQHQRRMSLDEVASVLSITPRTLRRRLQAVQLSFRQLRDEETLRQAMQRLDDPQQKVSSVATACGFSDLTSFRDAFRRWSGMTPSQYRQTIKRQNT